METIYIEKIRDLKKNLEEIETKLKVKLIFNGRLVTIDGDSLDEYEASIVLDAIGFGFSAKRALTLKDPELIFRKLNIKAFTRRKNLREVRARVIGEKGRTKRTIEEISNSNIILNENQNQVGIIGSAESIETATQALTNLIRGTKQANIYRFLEKMNAAKKMDYSTVSIKNRKNKKE